MIEDTPYTQRIPLAWRLDLDDFSTKIGQDTAGKRPGEELANLKDAHPIEGPRWDGVGGCHSRGSVQGHENAVTYTFVECFAQMPFPRRVLHKDHFAGANVARLAIAGGELYAIIEVDDVLPAGRPVPVQGISGGHFPENNACGRQALGESPRLRGLDILHFRIGKMRFAFIIRIESVDFHQFPPVRSARATMTSVSESACPTIA